MRGCLKTKSFQTDNVKQKNKEHRGAIFIFLFHIFLSNLLLVML